jgi:hypothetical protein
MLRVQIPPDFLHLAEFLFIQIDREYLQIENSSLVGDKMPSKRLAEETKLMVAENKDIELIPTMTVTCSAGDCEFMWIVEDEAGDEIPLPAFCPICGRRAS